MDFNAYCELPEYDIQNMDAEDLAETIDYLLWNLDRNPGLGLLARQQANRQIKLCRRYLQAFNLKTEGAMGRMIMGEGK